MFDSIRDKIVESIDSGSREAAETLVEELVKAAARAPEEMQPHIKKIVSMASRTVSAAGGDVSASVLKLESLRASNVNRVAGQSSMIATARTAATKAGLTGDRHAEFVCQITNRRL